MKVIIIAILLTYISAQAVVKVAETLDSRMSADELCWNSVCRARWTGYKVSSRRLQAVVQAAVNPMPSVTNGDCQERCYDQCMCPNTRRLQAVVATAPSGLECNKKCGGGGKGRRLQGMVSWRTVSCPQVCFDYCYEDKLGQLVVPKVCGARSLQSVQTNEQNAAQACKTQCNITAPVVENPVALGKECQSACLCRKIK
jgi:hypothetical protein